MSNEGWVGKNSTFTTGAEYSTWTLNGASRWNRIRIATDIDTSSTGQYLAVTLKNETPEVILEAVESVISSQSYLPTLTDLMKACNEINKMDGFPTAEEGYIEARKSYQPRAEFEWSHPIVYFAGKKIGWNNLNEKDSTENLKAFKKIFNSLKNDAINGKIFEIKDNTRLDARKPLNKSLFNKLRKKHKV